MDSFKNDPSRPKNVYLYWDFQNVRFSKKSNPENCINFILSLAQLKGELHSAKVYAYWRKERENIEKKFDELGFECLSLPDDTKNKVDRKIIQDCQKQVLQGVEKKIVVLVTGDSDFKSLVTELQSKQHEAIVIGPKQTSQKLKQMADCFCCVANLFCSLSELETPRSKTELQRALCTTRLLYADAVECLVKATEAILSQGKSACFPRVDGKMRQMNKLYRGVSSICTREGKTFNRFKDFVEAAARDGKIFVKQNEQNNELVLVRC